MEVQLSKVLAGNLLWRYSYQRYWQAISCGGTVIKGIGRQSPVEVYSYQSIGRQSPVEVYSYQRYWQAISCGGTVIHLAIQLPEDDQCSEASSQKSLHAHSPLQSVH